MSGLRTGVVTYGQLSVLRSLETHGPDHRAVANLVSVWEVPFGLGAAQVMDAWLQLVERHESLRTTYDLSGPTPVQTVHPYRPSRVAALELAEDSFAAALRLGAEAAVDPIDIETGSPWRAFVTTYQGDALHLVTVIHHVAADNGALRVLEEQLGVLLEGGALGPVVQPLEMAQEQQREPATRSVRHWTEAWGRIVPADRDPEDASERRRASLYSLEGLTAAQELSDRLKISVQSVVLGVGALALSRLKRTERMTFALMAANRLTTRWVPLVGSLNQFAPVTVTVDEEAHPPDYLRDCYVQSMTAYMNGCYDVDALKEGLREAGLPEGTRRPSPSTTTSSATWTPSRPPDPPAHRDRVASVHPAVRAELPPGSGHGEGSPHRSGREPRLSRRKSPSRSRGVDRGWSDQYVQGVRELPGRCLAG